MSTPFMATHNLSKRLLIIVTVDYTASAYSETGALLVSPLYGMQGIAELDPSKYTSFKQGGCGWRRHFVVKIGI